MERFDNNTDFLTGIFSFQYFIWNYDTYVRTHPRAKLIAFDLTKFKSINDNYGHAVGDKCLIHFAKTLAGLFTDDDMCVRRSGDEFLVLTDRSGEEIRFLLMQMIDVIKNDANAELLPVYYTFNAGICPTKPDREITEEKADATLYEAKKTDKRYIFYSDSFYSYINNLKEYAERIDKAVGEDSIIFRARNICSLDGKSIGTDDVYAIDSFTNDALDKDKLEELKKYTCLKKLDFANLKKIIAYSSVPKGNSLMININGQSLINEEDCDLVNTICALTSFDGFAPDKFILCINIDNIPKEKLINIFFKIDLLRENGFKVALQNLSLQSYGQIVNIWANSQIDFIKIHKDFWSYAFDDKKKRSLLEYSLPMFVDANTFPIFMKVENERDLAQLNELNVEKSLIIGDASGCKEHPLKLIKKQG